MRIHKSLLLFGASALLLTACGEDAAEPTSNSDEAENLRIELEEANARIEELEQELTEANEDVSNTSPENSENNDEDTVEETSNGLVGLNEEVAFGEGNEELFRLTVTRATNNQEAFPDHMVGLDDYNTDRIVAISIDYENIGIDDGYRPSTHDFQAYTKDGVGLNRISQQSGQDAISPGRKATTQIYFDFPEDVEELESIELDFLDYGNVLATFDVPVE